MAVEDLGRHSRFELRGDDVIGRQLEPQAPLLRPALDVARRVEQIGLDQRLADLDAARLEERVGHRAADQQRVDLGDQVLDHFELVGDLGAAEHGDERALRALEHPAEILDLLAHQQPGRRFLDVMDDAFGRGMGAVRRAERVVDVDVGQRGELPGEGRIVLLFLGVEAQVLEQHHAALAGGIDRRLRLLADAVVGELHRPAAEQL